MSSFESIGVEITLSANNIIYICGIYILLWSKITDFKGEFFAMTKKFTKAKNCLIFGNFNINLMNLISVVFCQDIYDFFISENYTPLIDILTRVTRTSATCLDEIDVSFLENFLPVFFKLNLVTTMHVSN